MDELDPAIWRNHHAQFHLSSEHDRPLLLAAGIHPYRCVTDHLAGDVGARAAGSESGDTAAATDRVEPAGDVLGAGHPAAGGDSRWYGRSDARHRCSNLAWR